MEKNFRRGTVNNVSGELRFFIETFLVLLKLIESCFYERKVVLNILTYGAIRCTLNFRLANN